MTTSTPTLTSLDTRDGLLAELAAIETEGWTTPRGERLLGHVRTRVVRPQVLAAGLNGPAADQAIATGWEVAWESLNSPAIREVDSPWGWLWVAVRRAILSEVMASAYLTSGRKSWRIAHARETGEAGAVLDPPLSLNRLMENGWDQPAPSERILPLGERLQAIVSQLVQVGWEPRTAHAVVEGVAVTVHRGTAKVASAHGWRPLAARLAVPPWQVRRVTVLLLGEPGWPGLVARLAAEGTHILDERGVRAAVRSTITKRVPTPVVAARQAPSHVEYQAAS